MFLGEIKIVVENFFDPSRAIRRAKKRCKFIDLYN